MKYYKILNATILNAHVWKYDGMKWYCYIGEDRKWYPCNYGPMHYLKEDVRQFASKQTFWNYTNLMNHRPYEECREPDRPRIVEINEKEAFIEIL